MIPHASGLAGHSDADVLTHAICDALLGALGLPDLGARFPDDDERNRGRSSLSFLENVMPEVRGRGFAILNLDTVLLAEAPRLQPHLEAMRRSLATALGCAEASIGLKAKRCEGLGAIGRGEGMMAPAVVLLGAAGPPRAGSPATRRRAARRRPRS